MAEVYGPLYWIKEDVPPVTYVSRDYVKIQCQRCGFFTSSYKLTPSGKGVLHVCLFEYKGEKNDIGVVWV